MQVGDVTPGNVLLISVFVLLLPMLGLATEHVQLATMYPMKPINQCHVNLCHMTYPLMMSYLNNTVPAMGIQNGLARSNIRCLSFHSSTCYVFPSPTLTFPFGLGQTVVLVAVALLLLMSGDVEINPGPVGKHIA